MVTEAAQARLDDTAPHVTVGAFIEESLRTPKTGYFERNSNGYLEEVSPTRTYSLPADSDLVVWIKIYTSVVNQGTEDVRVRLENVDLSSSVPSVHVEIESESRRTSRVSSTMNLSHTLAVGQAVKNWADHPELLCIVANLRVDDERDNGVIDTWPVQVAADGLVSSESGSLEWQTYPSVRTLPRRRAYFLSKIDGVPLVPSRRSYGRSRLNRFRST
jgi:hypothetical protein